jgi:hypothetical protein
MRIALIADVRSKLHALEACLAHAIEKGAKFMMVALPCENASDAILYSLREPAARSLGIRSGVLLACVTAIPDTT